MKDTFETISGDKLADVSGGFLGLLAPLLSSALPMVGNLLGGIGKKKAAQAEQINKQSGAGDQQAAAAPAGAGNMMGERAPAAAQG